MIWLLLSFALADDNSREQPTDVIGWTDDGVVVVEFTRETYTYEESTGKTVWRESQRISNGTPDGGGLGCFVFPDGDNNCEGEDAWKKVADSVHPGRSGQSCGASEAFFEVKDEKGYPGETIEGSWRDGGFEVSGGSSSGYVRVGVKRGGHVFEHLVRRYSGGMWTGALRIEPHWSPTCAYVLWMVIDTTPDMARDGYASDLYEGSVQMAPAGPSVMASSETPDALRAELVKAGWGVTHTTSNWTWGQNAVFAWSRAREAAEGLTRKMKVSKVEDLPPELAALGTVDIVAHQVQ